MPNKGFKTHTPSRFSHPLQSEVRELQAEIRELEKENNQLSSELIFFLLAVSELQLTIETLAQLGKVDLDSLPTIPSASVLQHCGLDEPEFKEYAESYFKLRTLLKSPRLP